MSFKIGDTVYRACAGHTQIWVECPECLGSGRLRVTLADETELSIECTCCERGYEGSPGKLSSYEFVGETNEMEITGVEEHLKEGKLQTRYSSGCWSIDAENVFATREEAQARSEQLVSEHKIEEAKRLKQKEKNTRSWSWNTTYHRRQIREAQRQLEYHTAKLNVASKRSKEESNVR